MKNFTKELKAENIPKELRDRAQWVVWKPVPRENGKTSKIPVDPKTGKNASHSDPNTWGEYHQALEYYESKKNGVSGIGYVFSANDPYVGIDLDNCIDLETGDLDQFAQDVIKSMDSYSEISPSGKGVHIFVRGKLPEGRRRDDRLGIEIYNDKRYFTVTGDVLDVRKEIHDRQDEVESLMKIIFSQHLDTEKSSGQQNSNTIGRPRLSDEAVIEEAMKAQNGEKFKRLWDGDLSDFGGDHSRADMALCCILAFWANKDSVQIDRLFRRSGLMREKWDKVHYANGQTYGQVTIQKAINENECNYQIGRPSVERIRREYKKTLTGDDIISALYANQDGDAALYAFLNRGRFLYDHSDKKWYEFREHHWQEDLKCNALDNVRQVIMAYNLEAYNRFRLEEKWGIRDGLYVKTSNYKRQYNDLLKRISQLRTIYRKKAVLELAACGENMLGITGNEWDQRPMLLACGNGVIDLQTGKLIEGKPEHYLKSASPINYIENFEDPILFIQFLSDIFAGKQEIVDYIHRLFGYCLMGKVREHVFPILWGKGRNGKGTLLQILSHILGPLAGPIQSSLLLDRGRLRDSAAPNPDILDLKGKRLVWASETKDGAMIDSAGVKRLVGGDILVARPMYGKHGICFEPSHTLFLMTNFKPQMPSGADDFALWQRIHLIPFKVAFVEKPKSELQRKIDKDLPEKLKKEAEGILSWMVRGCLEYQTRGLNPPEELEAATRQYQREEDVLRRFIDECCIKDPNSEIKAFELYGAYKKWCEKNERRDIGIRKFGERIKKGFGWKRSGGIKYLGIKLV